MTLVKQLTYVLSRGVVPSMEYSSGSENSSGLFPLYPSPHLAGIFVTLL